MQQHVHVHVDSWACMYGCQMVSTGGLRNKLSGCMYMNNHVHSAPQLERKKEKNRRGRSRGWGVSGRQVQRVAGGNRCQNSRGWGRGVPGGISVGGEASCSAGWRGFTLVVIWLTSRPHALCVISHSRC